MLHDVAQYISLLQVYIIHQRTVRVPLVRVRCQDRRSGTYLHFHPPSRCLSFCAMLSVYLYNRIHILCRGVIIPVWCQHSSSRRDTRSPVCPPFSANPSPVTILVIVSIICLRSSTSRCTNLATSLHPLHANTQVPPLISVQ